MTQTIEEKIKQAEKELQDLEAERDSLPDRFRSASEAANSEVVLQMTGRSGVIKMMITAAKLRVERLHLIADRSALEAAEASEERFRIIAEDARRKFEAARALKSAAVADHANAQNKRSGIEYRIDACEHTIGALETRLRGNGIGSEAFLR